MEITSAFAAAHAAAEPVRRFNHLTLASPAAGTDVGEHLPDVYAVVGELRLLARRLPQALGQVAAGFDHTPAGVGFGTDNGADPSGVVAEAVDALAAARGLADALQRHLEAAHEAISHVCVARELTVVDGDGAE